MLHKIENQVLNLVNDENICSTTKENIKQEKMSYKLEPSEHLIWGANACVWIPAVKLKFMIVHEELDIKLLGIIIAILCSCLLYIVILLLKILTHFLSVFLLWKTTQKVNNF